MKKLISLVLALALMATVGLAFAADDASTTADQTITINNALKGESYVIYKMMGATVDGNGGISYKGPIPQDLQDVLGFVEETVNGVTYNVLTKLPNVTDEALFAKLKAYATDATKVGEALNIQTTPVVFSGLTPGYYLITSTAGDKYIVTSTTPAQNTVNEKNDITIIVTKTAGDSYTIGSTVEYTVKYNGANYQGDKIVTEYLVEDTLPEFLKDAQITAIKIAGESKTVNETNFPGVTSFGTAKQFVIPWAEKDGNGVWQSKYNNNSEIEITYTATLTKIVKIEGANINKIKITPRYEGVPSHEPFQDDHKIYTYAAALKKVDGADTTKTLKGAKFQFKGLIVEEPYTGGVYTVKSYDPSSNDWGTEIEVGEDGMLYIIGLKDATSLTGQETKAPEGYNLIKGTFTLTAQKTGEEIWSETGMRYFDEDGNLMKEEITGKSHEVTVTKSLDELEPEALRVLNNKGSELPSTGGIGTTIFYILGGLLVIGAAVILVARRKAQD